MADSEVAVVADEQALGVDGRLAGVADFVGLLDPAYCPR